MFRFCPEHFNAFIQIGLRDEKIIWKHTEPPFLQSSNSLPDYKFIQFLVFNLFCPLDFYLAVMTLEEAQEVVTSRILLSPLVMHFSGEVRVKLNHHPFAKPGAGKKLCFSSPG